MFGDTPSGIILLDIILVVMGMILSPLLWGIFSRLGNMTVSVSECAKQLIESQAHLINIIKEQTEARVRDTEMQGRLKGLDEKLGRHIEEDRKR